MVVLFFYVKDTLAFIERSDRSFSLSISINNTITNGNISKARIVVETLKVFQIM